MAFDRASRWVYFTILTDKTAKGAQNRSNGSPRFAHSKSRKTLTDNGREFTDRFTAQGEREASEKHPFDQACKTPGVEHRLIPLAIRKLTAWRTLQ